MFKLVAIGGKLRGKVFKLEEGDNTIGRSAECEVQLSVEGLSKKHFKITVNKKKCYIQDLESSNGTFVNKKLVKSMTIQDKDQVAVPNVVFQLVYVKEKVVPKTDGFEEAKVDYSLEQKERVPSNTLGKIKYFFKHKVMQVIYSFNQQYEWNIMLALLLFLFICLSISVSIGPVLKRSNDMLRLEIKGRTTQYLNEVARYNAIHMARGQFQQIDTKYLEDLGPKEGLHSYELIDMERRIVRPASKIDTYSNDPVTIEASDFFKANSYQRNFIKEYSEGEIGVAKPLMVTNNRTGVLEPVGIISMRFRPKSLKNILIANSTAYLEALIFSSIIGVFFFGFIYYLTIKPIEQMRIQAINARAKRLKELSSDFLFQEISPIREEINSLLQSLSQFDDDADPEMMVDEDDGPYVDTLVEIGKAINCAVIVIDSSNKIQFSNEKTYDLLGLRDDMAHGQDLAESIQKDGIADELLIIAEDSANQVGAIASTSYELQGDNYMMNAKAMLGKNGMPQAYLFTFVREL